MAKKMKLLAVSGSLRSQSYNSRLLESIQRLSPSSIQIEIFKEMDQLPLFNPDIEEQPIPSVTNLKNALANASGLIIASPEYAHGISGVMKNALDWLVSGEEFVDMPVALLNTSPRASHAQLALREVVTTMSGIVIDRASISFPLLGSDFGVEEIITDQSLNTSITSMLELFSESIQQTHAQAINN